jgi:hypothetical protein
MASFLITLNWRGALNVEKMRVFEDVDQARNYYKKLIREDSDGSGIVHWVRGYDVSPNKEPKLIWSAAKDKAYK